MARALLREIEQTSVHREIIGMAFVRVIRALTAVLSLSALSSSLRAEPVGEFYEGKTISFVIGGPPAGAYDVYGRLAARYLGKYLAGNSAIVARNMPGAGGLLAANYVFNVAPRDGTTLAILVPTFPLEEKLGLSAAKYKASRFVWIGRMATQPNITFVSSRSQVKTVGDAFEKVALLGATGRSATNAIYPMVLNNVLGTKFKVVLGYEGSSAAMLAMERGEVEGHSSTYDGLKNQHPDWISSRKVNILVQYLLKRHPELPDVPTSAELARTPEQAVILRAVSSASEIGKFILTTPDTPRERVAALRTAFDAMVKDRDYLAEAAKLRIELDPMAGIELQKVVEEVQSMPPDIVEKVKTIYPLN
jgi:tripartite-type tricarboxylate transporter receptor subunit TctC